MVPASPESPELADGALSRQASHLAALPGRRGSRGAAVSAAERELSRSRDMTVPTPTAMTAVAAIVAPARAMVRPGRIAKRRPRWKGSSTKR